MAYKALLDKSLRIAFLNLKDLAIDLTIESVSTTFDFNSKEATDKGTKAIVKAVNTSNKRGRTDSGSKDLNEIKEVEFMLKRPQNIDLKIGDKVSDGVYNYQIARLVKDDGYISIIQVVKQ